jgi:outer membrane protein TolC
MRRFVAGTAVTGLIVVLALVLPSICAEPQGKPKDDDAAQLKALQDERVEVLTELVKCTVAQYQVGGVTIDAVISAQNELVAAKLDATDETEKRIALLTQQLEMVTQLLKITEARHEMGRTTMTDVYRAKSLLLDVKIKLARERSKHKTRTPSSLK